MYPLSTIEEGTDLHFYEIIAKAKSEGLYLHIFDHKYNSLRDIDDRYADSFHNTIEINHS